ARGSELTQELVTRQLPLGNGELRRDQRLLQDHRRVVRRLASDAEQLGKTELRGLFAKLRIEVVDTDFVRRVGIGELLRLRIELVAARFGVAKQRCLLSRGGSIVLRTSALVSLVLVRTDLFHARQELIERGGLLLGLSLDRDEELSNDCRNGQQGSKFDHDRTSCGAGTGTVNNSGAPSPRATRSASSTASA